MKKWTLVLLALGMFSACKKDCEGSNPPANSEPNTLDSGLVAYYAFSGTAKDSTSNHNDGQVSGAILTEDRLGNANKAYYFNGTNNYIKIPYSTSLDMRGSFSISVWIKPELNTVDIPPYSMIILHGSLAAGHDPYYLCYHNQYGNLLVGTDQGDGTVANQLTNATGVSLIKVWTHVTAVWDATTKTSKLYINGNLSEQKTFSSNPISYATNGPEWVTWIGLYGDSHGAYKGVVDEVRFYNRVITAKEAEKLFRK